MSTKLTTKKLFNYLHNWKNMKWFYSSSQRSQFVPIKFIHLNSHKLHSNKLNPQATTHVWLSKTTNLMLFCLVHVNIHKLNKVIFFNELFLLNILQFCNLFKFIVRRRRNLRSTFLLRHNMASK